MFGYAKKAALLVIVASSMIFAACTPAATPSPTPDLNALQTEVAVTVQAGLTATALAMPTATPTLEPTVTLQPTATKAVINTPITSTLAPLVTSSPAVSGVKDKGQWLFNTPDDTKSTPQITPGADFTVTWRVKNVGTTTWTTKYQFRYFLADPALRLGAKDITLPKEVKPNDEVDLTLTFKAPTASGDYTTWWVVTNEEGANFLNVNFTFRIGSGSPATAAPSATSAPASTNTPGTSTTP